MYYFRRYMARKLHRDHDDLAAPDGKRGNITFCPVAPSASLSEPLVLLCAWSSIPRTLGDVLYQKRYEEGSHFNWWGTPDLLIDDLMKIFAKDNGIN
ncbi:hypothetical protein S40288_00392, partial [Stachybotrys chartarum IBT 40288]